MKRRRLHSRLNQEKDFVSAVVETAAPLIIALDSEGRIAKLNRATCETTGTGESDLEGQDFLQALLDEPADGGDVLGTLESLLNGEERICRFEKPR